MVMGMAETVRSHPFSQGEDSIAMATHSDQPRQPEPIDRRRLIISTTLSLLVLVLCLFLTAGTWAWPRGWLFLGVLLTSSILRMIYLRRVNPDVVAGRVNRHEWPRRWEKSDSGRVHPGS